MDGNFRRCEPARIKIHDGGGEKGQPGERASERVCGEDYIMWEWTEGARGPRNGPIRLSHLITTVVTTTLSTLLTLLRRIAPARGIGYIYEESPKRGAARAPQIKGAGKRVEGSR